MASDWQEPDREETWQEQALRETRRRTAIYVILGVPASLLLAACGGYLLATGSKGRGFVTAFGGAAILFWIIEVPIVLRSGRLVIGGSRVASPPDTEGGD
jgi:hypothetical protein